MRPIFEQTCSSFGVWTPLSVIFGIAEIFFVVVAAIFKNTFQQQLHQNIWQKKHFLVGRSRLGTNLLLARRMEL